MHTQNLANVQIHDASLVFNNKNRVRFQKFHPIFPFLIMYPKLLRMKNRFATDYEFDKLYH